MFKINNKETFTDTTSLLLTLSIFYKFFDSASIADFEQVNSCWDSM